MIALTADLEALLQLRLPLSFDAGSGAIRDREGLVIGQINSAIGDADFRKVGAAMVAACSQAGVGTLRERLPQDPRRHPTPAEMQVLERERDDALTEWRSMQVALDVVTRERDETRAEVERLQARVDDLAEQLRRTATGEAKSGFGTPLPQLPCGWTTSDDEVCVLAAGHDGAHETADA